MTKTFSIFGKFLLSLGRKGNKTEMNKFVPARRNRCVDTNIILKEKLFYILFLMNII